MSSNENLHNYELYQQYCQAFDQLMDIIENPDENVDPDKLSDVHYTLKKLEQAFITEQEAIKNTIAGEQMKKRVNSTYLSTAKIIQFPSFNKKS